MAAGSPVYNAVERPLPSAAARVSPAVGTRLPLAFIALGLVAFSGGAAWLALRPGLLLFPYPHPHVVAFVHVWLPGFLLTTSLGAMYQLMPVVLGVPLRGRPLTGWLHFSLHAAGLLLLIGGFVLGRFELVALGGSAVSAGILLFGGLVGRTFRDSRRRDSVAWSFPLATGWLVATVLAGVLLALNRRWPFLSLSPLALLQAHAHLGLVGFFLTLLQGATFQLVPMFTMGEFRRARAATAGLVLTQIALPLLFVGLATPAFALSVAGAITLVAGLTLSGVALAATLRTRRRRHLEPGVAAFVIGAGGLGLATLLGLGLLLAPPHLRSVNVAAAYGIFIFFGGLGLMIPGMLCKIIPFLVWMRRYGPRVGREPVPSATTLSSSTLERTWFGLQIAATVGLVTAVLIPSTLLAAAGTLLLAGGVTAFLLNVARVLFHLRKAGPNPSVLPVTTLLRP